MTEDEVKALYPGFRFDLTPRCRMFIGYSRDRQKRIVSVTLGQTWAFPTGSTCGAIARDGLEVKYGPPVRLNMIDEGAFGTHELSRFEDGEIAVVFKGDSAAPSTSGEKQYGNYTITYSLREPSADISNRL